MSDEAFELSYFLNGTPRGVVSPPSRSREQTHLFTRGGKNIFDKTFSTIAKTDEYDHFPKTPKIPFTPLHNNLVHPSNDSSTYTTPVAWDRGSRLLPTEHTQEVSPSGSVYMPSGYSMEHAAPSALLNAICLRRALCKLDSSRKCWHKIAFARHVWVLKSYKRFFKRLKVYQRRHMGQSGHESAFMSAKSFSLRSRLSVSETRPATTSTTLVKSSSSFNKHTNEMTRVSSVTHLSLQETIVIPVAACIKVLACTQAWLRHWERRWQAGCGKWDRSPAMALYEHVTSVRDHRFLHAGTETWLHERIVNMLRYNALFGYFRDWCTHAGLSVHAKQFFVSVALRRGYSALYVNMYRNKKKPWTRADHARYECMIGKFRVRFRKWRKLVFRQRHVRSFDYMLPKKRLLRQLRKFVDVQNHRRFMLTVGNSQYCDALCQIALRRWKCFRKTRAELSEQNGMLRSFSLRLAFRRFDCRTRVMRPVNMLLRSRKREIWNIWRANYYKHLHYNDTIVNGRYKTLQKKMFWKAWLYAVTGVRAERHILRLRSHRMLGFWKLWIHRKKKGSGIYSGLRDMYTRHPCFLRAIHLIMHPVLVRCFDALKTHMHSYESRGSTRMASRQWKRVALSQYLVRWYRRTLFNMEAYIDIKHRRIKNRLLRQDSIAELRALNFRGAKRQQSQSTTQNYLTSIKNLRKYNLLLKSLTPSEDIPGEKITSIHVSWRRISAIAVLCQCYLRRWKNRTQRVHLFSSLEEGVNTVMGGVKGSRATHRGSGTASDGALPEKGMRREKGSAFVGSADSTRLFLSRESVMRRYLAFEGVEKVHGTPEILSFAFVACNNEQKKVVPGNELSIYYVCDSQLPLLFNGGNSTTRFTINDASYSLVKRRIVSYVRTLAHAVQVTLMNRKWLRQKLYALAQRSQGMDKNRKRLQSTLSLVGSTNNPGKAMLLFFWFDRFLGRTRSRFFRRQVFAMRIKRRIDLEKRMGIRHLLRNVFMRKAGKRVLTVRKKYIFFRIKAGFVTSKHRRLEQSKILLFLHSRLQRSILERAIGCMQSYKLRAGFCRWKRDLLRVAECFENAASLIRENSKRLFFAAWMEELMSHRGRRISTEHTMRRVFNFMVLNKRACRMLRFFSKRRYVNKWLDRTISKNEIMMRSSLYFTQRCVAKAFHRLAIGTNVKCSTALTAYLPAGVQLASPAKSNSMSRHSIHAKRTLIEVEREELLRLISCISGNHVSRNFKNTVSPVLAKVNKYNILYEGHLRGDMGEELQTVAQHQRRDLVSKCLFSSVQLLRGIKSLQLWYNLNAEDRDMFRLETLCRQLYRFRRRNEVVGGLRGVLNVADKYSEDMLQRRAMRKWRERIKVKSKLNSDVNRGKEFHFFNKCAVSMVLWYSISKPQSI